MYTARITTIWYVDLFCNYYNVQADSLTLHQGSTPLYNAHYGKGIHSIIGGPIQCSGQESSLLECDRNDKVFGQCTINEVAGIRCQGKVCVLHVHSYILEL